MRIQIERMTAALLKLIEWIMAIVGAELVLVVTYGIVRRYIFRSPLKWGYELSILSFLWVSFLGAAVALKTRQHVEFDMAVNLFPAKLARPLMVLRDLVMFGILVPGTAYGVIIFTRIYPQQFQTLRLSLGWMYLALPVGFGLMSIFMAEMLIEDVGALINKHAASREE